MIEQPSVWPGHHAPLGARVHPEATGEAANFAVWAPEATGVDLCLFDDEGTEERLRLTEQS
ncbi:MAG: hypothetical protein ACRDO0_20185, partial [Nocardioidaceae bacterium]